MQISANHTYDANGNTLSDPSGKQYTWDFDNRLIQAIVPNVGTTTFRYDPFGRRIQKSGPLGTTNYLYDGMDVIEDLDNSGNVLARYMHGAVIDEDLSMLRGGTTSYYQADGLGSITSLSNGAGALANTYSYDSFGNSTASGGTLSNPFRYTGREFDSETGVYEYRARYYDQNLGRFISEDPIRFKGGDNFYDYVLNSPTNFMDPTGKVCVYSQEIGRMICYASCAVIPSQPQHCTAHPPTAPGPIYYDETGYSGNGPGKNNPLYQDVEDVGTIPQGNWAMDGNWYNKKPGPGKNIINLLQLPGNTCFSTTRKCETTFRMHGDSTDPKHRGQASGGCIVMPANRTNIPLNETIGVVP